MAAVQPFTDVVDNNVPGQKGKEQSNIFLHGVHLFHSGLYLHYIIFRMKIIDFCGEWTMMCVAKESNYAYHGQSKTPGSGRDFRGFLFRLCKVV